MEINRAGKPGTSHTPSAGAELSRERMCRPRRPLRASALCLIFAFAVLLGAGQSTTLAQQVQPTPEQMNMINQLPPEQRQQAMEALRQFQAQQQPPVSQTGAVEQPAPAAATAYPVEPITPLEVEIPKAEGGSSLVITLTPKVTLTPEQLTAIEEDKALSRIRGSHYYELDDSGVLLLPGLADIPLLGLTAGAVEQRLGAEPALSDFDISASLLSTESIGADALLPFGYDLFAPVEPGMAAPPEIGTQIGFEPPPMSGPVPPDYVLGPDDIVRVQLFGNVNNVYELQVSRDGFVNFPELGPINVAGLRFSEVRAEINSRVEQMLIGTQASITMGPLRTVRVFVVGDVVHPGSYIVSSLATISSALYRSGGISEVGTLRDIQLKRQGQIVARLDLYDLLLSGDTSDDVQLQQGDAIFVPPVGTTVGVGGAVKRPAIYESKGEATIAEALSLAGGLAPDAFPEAGTLQRINADKERSVISVDAASSKGRSLPIHDGDTLMIPRVLEELTDTVVLQGHVYRPGPREWYAGMRLTDLIRSMGALQPGADPNYVLIHRKSTDNRIETLSADLAAAMAAPRTKANVPLESRDTVHVFNLAFGRQRIIEPILEELKLQSKFDASYYEVRVDGSVRAPGAYPMHGGMRISDLLRAGGSLAEGAYTTDAELTRFSVVDGEYRQKEIVEVDLNAVLRGNRSADLELMPSDHLSISAVPDWDSDWSVTLEGEVRFPGDYQILQGETLSDLVERAGGLTEEAFPEGAIFLREELQEREREQLDALARRMESDLASLSLETLEGGAGAQALTVGQSLLTQLRTTEPIGRMVIDVAQIVTGTSRQRRANDVELRDGDRILVPIRSQSVMVLGEVQYPASHLYSENLTRDDYISRSGGLTRRADRKLVYIVRASGAVVSGNRSSWFRRDEGSEIRPGDTIVIPLETDKIRPLTFWTNVTQILYQAAIAIAAVRTFDN